MRRTRDSNASLFFAWNTQEEVGGLRGGIQAVVNRVNPDLAIVVETTTAADVPGNPEEQWITALCGGGAAVRAMDRSMITNPVLLSKSLEALEARRVKYQVQVNPLRRDRCWGGSSHSWNRSADPCHIDPPRQVHSLT